VNATGEFKPLGMPSPATPRPTLGLRAVMDVLAVWRVSNYLPFSQDDFDRNGAWKSEGL
jgi:hypothetical protein